MVGFQIILDGDGCWPDLQTKGFERAVLAGAAILKDGTVGGAPTISFRCELEDGRVVLAETTYALFSSAVRAFQGKLEAEKPWKPSVIGPPRSFPEYELRFAQNTHVSGYGVEVTQHMPCPFCAAAEWLAARIVDIEQAMGKETICPECGRGCKAIYTRQGPALSFEFVQTCGEDQPAWLPPMRRVAS